MAGVGKKNKKKIHARENAKKKNSCKEEGKEKNSCRRKVQLLPLFTALFTNMRILKIKSQPTIAFFAAVNHLNGPLRK